jgi:hypothetical protein
VNISSNARDALRAVKNESPENRMLRSRKILIDLENNPSEVSHRVVQDLRAVLRSVQKCETANAEQIAQAGSLLLRLKPLDPRRLKRLKQNAAETEEAVEANEQSPNNLSVQPTPVEVGKKLTEQFWADLAARCK